MKILVLFQYSGIVKLLIENNSFDQTPESSFSMNILETVKWFVFKQLSAKCFLKICSEYPTHGQKYPTLAFWLHN